MEGFKVVKRDGKLVDFDFNRIELAVINAYEDYYGEDCFDDLEIEDVLDNIYDEIVVFGDESISVEEIQNIVVDKLTDINKDVGKAYEEYRNERNRIREIRGETFKNIEGIINGTNKATLNENGNKKGELNSVQRDLIAGEVSKAMARKIIPKDIYKAHEKGGLHIHDLDYIIQNMYNCCLVNLKDMLDNGTVINGKMIETPNSLRTAMNVATQISAVVASNQYGGQTISISHLAPYLRKSINTIKQKYENIRYLLKDGSEDKLNELIDKEIKKEIKDSVQTLSYQINTLSSTNGQTPFLSLALYLNEDKEYIKETALLIEEVFKQRMLGIKNENGVYETPPFPKLLYFLDENNTYEDSEYFWLTKLSAECCAKRMNPDYISVKRMKELIGYAFPCMGCRAFLSPIKTKEGKTIDDFYGRGNLGVCTLNLPYIALESIRDNRDFYEVLDEYLDKVRRVGELRWNKLEGVTTSVAPLLWEHGAISRKPKGTKIVDIMKERGFTTTIGFSGLWETVQALIGEPLTSERGFKKGEEILIHIEQTRDKWNDEKPHMKWAIYASPQENTTDKFARALKREFGIVENVSDRDFVTNGFHIHVEHPIDAFSKLSIEGKLQEHVLGGTVSYIEVLNMSKNIPALIKIIQHIYENIQYAEINFEADLCNECMYQGAMNRNEELNRWECPNCGNVNQDTISVTRRLCGYINSSKEWSKGRLKDILSRVKHL